jgi:GT2 family glycosyltransferase
MVERPQDLLTVIIPTWNQRELLRDCLKSLHNQTCVPSILVVDNASTDGTVDIVRTEFPEVKLLCLPSNLGFAKAANQGILRCTTVYVALLNNDTEADREWVESGLEALENQTDYAFFASRMIRFHSRDRLDSAGDCYTRGGLPYKRGFGEPVEAFPEPEPVLAASAGAAFYRRSLFDKAGLFDEDLFMYLEDVELSLRAQSAGLRCLYIPDALVYHWEAASDPDREISSDRQQHSSGFYTPNRVYWITRNRWLLMILYQPLHHFPWLAWAWVKSCLFHALKAGYLGSFLKGVLGGLGATPVFLRKRRHLKQKMIISTRELCQLFKAC